METKTNTNTVLLIMSVLLVGAMAINLYLQFGLQEKASSLQNSIALLSLAGGQTTAGQSTGQLDMSDWTANEKMNYEMHGIIPARAKGSATALATNPAPASQQNEQELQALFAEIMPKGIPKIYGEALGVSYDKPVESLNVLSKLDGDLFPNGKYKFAQLSDAQKQRYLKIGQSISCEFCCGATTLIAPNGKPACGCAHSAVMRGLAMHLLINNENDYTDSEMLSELTKWKTLFFPKQMVQKAIDLKAQNGEISPTSLNQLPEMVGGC